MTPLDGNHALLIGNVAGALLKMADDIREDIPTHVEIEVINGDYTNCIFVTRDSGRYAVKVEKLPDEYDPRDVDRHLADNPHWPHG